MEQENVSPYKNKVLTIPNLLSLVRLCLIPVIVWLYVGQEDPRGALIVLILSALTDIADGIIARKCNMISDFGKAFDPVADKLTQVAMLYCLLSRYPAMLLPLVLLVLKELTTGIMSLISIHKTGTVDGAVWHGKVTTVSLYSMMAIHMVWYGIPAVLSNLLILICVVLMTLSFILYGKRNVQAIRNSREDT